MSAADDMDSASDFLDRGEGTSIPDAITQGIAAWALAAFSAGITGMQQVLDLILFTPVDVGTEIIWASGEGFVIEPINTVLPEGAQVTAESLDQFGYVALLAGGAIVLAFFYMMIRFYLSRGETTDGPFPGIGFDVIPFVGVEEEDTEDE